MKTLNISINYEKVLKQSQSIELMRTVVLFFLYRNRWHTVIEGKNMNPEELWDALLEIFN